MMHGAPNVKYITYMKSLRISTITKYIKEGNIKMKETSLLQKQMNFTLRRSDVLQYLLE